MVSYAAFSARAGSRFSTRNVKKETKESARLFCIALIVMLAVPLAYRVCVHFWPPDEKPRQSLAQIFKETESERCVKLLTKPIGRWTEAEVKSEPEIYAWLQERGNEILPWEWTDEARRKDPKDYAMCWRRIWKERKRHCENLLDQQQGELKRLNRERQALITVYTHRTNQIARLRALAATNDFPCQVVLERLEKGRFWGWNKNVEVETCQDAMAILAATNGICSREAATAQDELRAALSLADAVAALEEEAALQEKLRAVCDQNCRLAEDAYAQDEALKKSLVENLKRARR